MPRDMEAYRQHQQRHASSRAEERGADWDKEYEEEEVLKLKEEDDEEDSRKLDSLVYVLCLYNYDEHICYSEQVCYLILNLLYGSAL